MREYALEWPRHSSEVQRLDEQTGVADLAAAAAAQEAPELLLGGPSAPCRLLLKGSERLEVTLGLDDPLDGAGSQGPDQLLLQVGDADVEPESFHLRPREIGAEAGPLKAAAEVVLLCRVAEPRQPDVKASRAEPREEPSDGLRPSNRDHRDALGVKIATTALRERFERALVADPLDEHDRAQVDACVRRT